MLHTMKTLSVIACVSLFLAACASEPRPTEQLARARSLIQQADAANVQRYAADEITQARDKLQEAEKADADEQHDVARRRATYE